MNLTKDEAYAVASFIDSDLIEMIRRDTDIDSLGWVINMVTAYQKLCAFSGYHGMTDDCAKEFTYDEFQEKE